MRDNVNDPLIPDNTEHEDYIREEIDSLVGRYDSDRDFRGDLVTILTQKILEQEKRAKSLKNYPDFYTSDAFPDELAIELARATRDFRDKDHYLGAALIFIGSHGLKAINKKYNHSIGDKAVALLIEAIRLNTREIDTKGRVNGDKFAVFLSDINSLRVLEIAESILKYVERNKSQQLELFSVSLGVLFYQNEVAAEDLLLQAFDAVNLAKENESSMAITGIPNEEMAKEIAEFINQHQIKALIEGVTSNFSYGAKYQSL